MSSDHGPGAPSFGDLFEDPDSPVVPSAAPVDPVALRRGAAPSGAEAGSPPVADVPDDRAAHDLDHVSAEAEHLVAGFEADDVEGDEPGAEPAPAGGRRPAGTPLEPASSAAAGAAGPGTPVTVAPAAVGSGAPVTVDPRPPVVVEPGAPISVAPVVRPWDGTVDPSISSAPAGRVDTGRLYRSAGAEGPATLDAIPAIDPEHGPGRRVEVAVEKPVRQPSADSGLTYSGVVVVVVGVTVLVGFAEALIRHEIGWLTGLALLVSSVYAAVVVRRADIWAAVVVPPLAFLAAALTAGQLTLDTSGSLLIREGFTLFRTLATDAPWILGSTAVCLVIVLVRRRRA